MSTVTDSKTEGYGLELIHNVLENSNENLGAFAMGHDLAKFSAHLTRDDYAYLTFASPFESVPGLKEPERFLPSCYFQNPPQLKVSHISSLPLDTLFYIFYGMARDTLQVYAGFELKTRKFSYHPELNFWFIPNKEGTGYSYFNPETWTLEPWTGFINVNDFLPDATIQEYLKKVLPQNNAAAAAAAQPAPQQQTMAPAPAPVPAANIAAGVPAHVQPQQIQQQQMHQQQQHQQQQQMQHQQQMQQQQQQQQHQMLAQQQMQSQQMPQQMQPQQYYQQPMPQQMPMQQQQMQYGHPQAYAQQPTQQFLNYGKPPQMQQMQPVQQMMPPHMMTTHVQMPAQMQMGMMPPMGYNQMPMQMQPQPQPQQMMGMNYGYQQQPPMAQWPIRR